MCAHYKCMHNNNILSLIFSVVVRFLVIFIQTASAYLDAWTLRLILLNKQAVTLSAAKSCLHCKSEAGDNCQRATFNLTVICLMEKCCSSTPEIKYLSDYYWGWVESWRILSPCCHEVGWNVFWERIDVVGWEDVWLVGHRALGLGVDLGRLGEGLFTVTLRLCASDALDHRGWRRMVGVQYNTIYWKQQQTCMQ